MDSLKSATISYLVRSKDLAKNPVQEKKPAGVKKP